MGTAVSGSLEAKELGKVTKLVKAELGYESPKDTLPGWSASTGPDTPAGTVPTSLPHQAVSLCHTPVSVTALTLSFTISPGDCRDFQDRTVSFSTAFPLQHGRCSDSVAE